MRSPRARRRPSSTAARRAARRASRRPRLRERYDVLLAAFRRGATPRRSTRARDRPVVPARAAGAGAAIPRRRSPASARSAPSTPAPPSSPAETPYFYSGWERGGSRATRSRRGDRPSVVILGAGPNRIGQGIEFDYCCVHAAMTVRASGRDAVMINCNPETVSTDYDTSDRLYFEPLTLEDVLAVVEVEQPEGVIVQFGGQTPLKLAAGLQDAGVPILGTSVDAIDLAEDRGALRRRCSTGSATRRRRTRPRTSVDEALAAAPRGRLPAARAPELRARRPRDGDRLLTRRPARLPRARRGNAQRRAGRSSSTASWRTRSRSTSTRCATASDVWIGGIMQHVEEAGVHSGDSACVLPPHSLGPRDARRDPRARRAASRSALGVVGLVNVQYAVHDGELYVIEANPRASRTVPFVSKAIGVPLAKMACRLMLGERLADLGLPADPMRARPRLRQGGRAAVRPLRGLGRRARPGDALDRRGHGHRARLPDRVRQGAGRGRRRSCPTAARSFITRDRLRQAGRRRPSPRRCTTSASGSSRPAAPRRRSADGRARRRGAQKIGEGSPNVVDWIERGEVDLVINTPTGSGARTDGWEIRRAAVARGIPCITTLVGRHGRGARDRRRARTREPGVLSLQEIHRERTRAYDVARTPLVRSDSEVAGNPCKRCHICLNLPRFPSSSRWRSSQFVALLGG